MCSNSADEEEEKEDTSRHIAPTIISPMIATHCLIGHVTQKFE